SDAVIERGHTGAVVRNPPRTCWASSQPPGIDELRILGIHYVRPETRDTGNQVCLVIVLTEDRWRKQQTEQHNYSMKFRRRLAQRHCNSPPCLGAGAGSLIVSVTRMSMSSVL